MNECGNNCKGKGAGSGEKEDLKKLEEKLKKLYNKKQRLTEGETKRINQLRIRIKDLRNESKPGQQKPSDVHHPSPPRELDNNVSADDYGDNYYSDLKTPPEIEAPPQPFDEQSTSSLAGHTHHYGTLDGKNLKDYGIEDASTYNYKEAFEQARQESFLSSEWSYVSEDKTHGKGSSSGSSNPKPKVKGIWGEIEELEDE